MLSVLIFPKTSAADIKDTVLYKYVHEDRGYTHTYSPRFHSNKYGLDIRVYTVASQEWQGYQLYNQVVVAMPEGASKDVTHAAVAIAGGSFEDEHLLPPNENEVSRFEKKLRRYAMIANQLNTPIVVVRNVPFQRLSLCPETNPEGNSEDDLIACTFKKHLDSGDTSWPALLPMTKSVHVALDVAQEVFADEWGMDVKTFTALGASKRGWTTFLSAAVDDRITGAVPIVIDMLNLPAHLDLQVAAWGTHSRQIQDYANHAILSRLDTKEGKALIEMVDPFSYRSEYDMPMLIVLGTNDDYWPVDSANLYYHDLGTEKYLLYLPNQGHKAADYFRLLAASKALHTSAETGVRLPDLNWVFKEKNGNLRVSFSSDIQPVGMTLWSAQSSDRDFRDDVFRSKSICLANGCESVFETVVEIDPELCESFYVEFWFTHDGIETYPLTTTQHVTGGAACLSTQYLAEKGDESQ